MLAGLYRHRVAIEAKTVVPGPAGPVETWTVKQRRWARVVPMDAKARIQYQQLQSECSHVILFRGAVDLKLAEHRYVWRDRVYTPTEPAFDPDGLGKEMLVAVKLAR